jgi:hypothetical protein
MMTLTPSLLVASANAMVDVKPMGAWKAGGVAFVRHAGFNSHYDDFSKRSSWPLPPVHDAHELAHFARENGILSVEYPKAGEIFLRWSCQRKRFTRVGIVVHVETGVARADAAGYIICGTIESPVLEHGAWRDQRVQRIKHKLSPELGDRFVRWVNLDNRVPATEPFSERTICALRMRMAAAA